MTRFTGFEDLKAGLGERLLLLGKEGGAERYIAQSGKLAAAAFGIALLLWQLFSRDFIAGVLVASLAAAAAFGWRLGWPKGEMRRRAKRVDRDLPFALMQLSVHLNIGVPFDAALAGVAEGDYGILSDELRRRLRAARLSGRPVRAALFGMASAVRSRQFTRAVSQLVSVYEQGAKSGQGEGVRRMAMEQLARQKAEAKEFSGKLAVFSLAFIVVSAIVPALFQAFVIVGGSFIEIPFTAAELLLIVALGFPLVDALMLFYIRSMTPEFLKG